MRQMAIVAVMVVLIAWGGAAVASFAMVEWRSGDATVTAEDSADDEYGDPCDYVLPDEPWPDYCPTPPYTPGDFRP